MTWRRKATFAAILLGGCVQEVDLGVPMPVHDAGVDADPDMGEPDAPPHLPCLELDRAACDEREECDWYGHDEGFCDEAGPCDEQAEHRGCVTDAACDWDGEADGFCVPTGSDPTPCSPLYHLHCEETPGCLWEGGDLFGECAGEPEPPCAGLAMGFCHGERCHWYGEGVGGFCDEAGPCAAVAEYQECITRSSCDWRGDVDGFCGPTDGDPGGCAEIVPQTLCEDVGCLWDDGAAGECVGTPDPLPECEFLEPAAVCREDARCNWYGPEDGGFCSPATVCDEVSSHGACVLRAACDWFGEAEGFCLPTDVPVGDCSALGFLACSHNEGCAWDDGDFGECFDL